MVSERTGRSRADAGRVIRRGRVTVSGEVVRDPGARIADGAALALDGEALDARPAPPRLVLFHKPLGVVSTLDDEAGRPSLLTAARALVDLGLHPVGRLDADTDGLLLWSAEGPLTQHLLHPRRAIPRTYLATVEGHPGPALREVLAAGVRTADGVFAGEVLALDGDRVTVRVTEGKHRMVRRMLANAGFPVVALRRLSYGPFVLGDLAAGDWRPATPEELTTLPS